MTDYGRCLAARATHERSRNLRSVSALCVGIAIALSGCRANRLPPDDEEIPPRFYFSIAESVEFERPNSARLTLIRKFMADDKITYAELKALNNQDTKLRDDALRGAVNAVKEGLKASGMEARQGGNEVPSRSDDSPTAEGGDAQRSEP